MNAPFNPVNAGIGLDFLAEAEAIHAAQQARYDLYKPGVRWAGLTDEPAPVQSVPEIQRQLIAQEAKNEAFRNSPLGKLWACIRELDDLGYGEEGAKLKSLYRTVLSDPGVDSETMNRAGWASITVLSKINHPEARAAERYLAELLMGPLKRAA